MTLLKNDTQTRKFWTLLALTLFAVAAAAAAANAQEAIEAAGADAYTWSAELVAFDMTNSTATVKTSVVNHATMGDLSGYKEGERVVLTWSGAYDYASGVRGIARGEMAKEPFTMPVDFVSVEPDGRYITFRLSVPAEHHARIQAIEPGQWVTVTSPHTPADSTEAVQAIRSYTDIG